MGSYMWIGISLDFDFFGIPVGTYYITNLPVRGIYIGVIVFSAGILFRLALDIWQNKRKK